MTPLTSLASASSIPLNQINATIVLLLCVLYSLNVSDDPVGRRSRVYTNAAVLSVTVRRVNGGLRLYRIAVAGVGPPCDWLPRGGAVEIESLSGLEQLSFSYAACPGQRKSSGIADPRRLPSRERIILAFSC